MSIHGTNSKYQMGCRCDDCKAGHREYERSRRRLDGVPPPGNPVAHAGVLYPTQSAAAAAFGVNERTIRTHLDRHGDLSRVKAKAQHHGAQV